MANKQKQKKTIELKRLQAIRKLAIIAMFSDDELMQMFVLKGGNAISLLIEDYSRASIDLDFSLGNDIETERLPIIEGKIKIVLEKTFKENGYEVFDFKFYPKPKQRHPGLEDFWGGYRAEFKAIEESKLEASGGTINDLRKFSLSLGEGDKKTFTIDISKHEYCEPKKDLRLDGYTIYIYTPEMMVIEKIRAICQQMPDYPYGRNTKSARARDFYDIRLLIEKCEIKLESFENLELTRLIFKAKDVPLNLIGKIPEQRDFHSKDFASVTSSTQAVLRNFDYYFDYVVETTKSLKVLWEI